LLVLALLIPPAVGAAPAAHAAPTPLPDSAITSPYQQPVDAAELPGVDDSDFPPQESITPLVITPTLPIYVELRLDRYFLLPGESAVLTLTVTTQPLFEAPAMTVQLTLPPGLITTSDGQSGTLTWTVGPLPAEQSFRQVLAVTGDGLVERGVLALTALVSAPGYAPISTQSTLGLLPPTTLTTATHGPLGTVLHDPARGFTLLVPADAAPVGAHFAYTPIYRADQPTGEPTPTETPIATLTPTVLPTAPSEPSATPQPPASPSPTSTPTATVTVAPEVTPEVILVVTPWLTPTATSELTPTIAPAGVITVLTTTVVNTETSAVLTLSPLLPFTPSLFLPEVSNDPAAMAASALITTPTPLTESVAITALQPILDNGVTVYQQWELNALYASQPITQFPTALLLVLDARWLTAAGRDPESLQFWTRENTADEWQVEEIVYDPVHAVLVARLTHFSGGSIGDGLSARGQLLPSLKGVTSDRQSGAATVQYAIDTPGGLGGLSPSLSLAYNSSVVDDFLVAGGDDDYVNQASWVGHGWTLGGISYIARAEIGSSNDAQGAYSLVLNGRRSAINGGWDPNDTNVHLESEYFTKIKAVKNSTLYGWEVTGTDGTLYTFGGPPLAEGWPTTQVTQTVASGQHLRATKKHLYDKWYLSEVKDRLGNRMTFHYEAYRGAIQNWGGCGTGYGAGEENLVWYTQQILPTEIRWHYMDATNYKMRVRFEESGDVREDWKVPGYDENCQQPTYTKRRLNALWVEVKVANGNWHVLRKYTLGYISPTGTTYPCGPQNCARPPLEERHLLLGTIRYDGKNGDSIPLHTYKFTYDANQTIAGANSTITTNNVRLVQVDNDWQGKTAFEYLGVLLSNAECDYTNVCTQTNQGNERRYRFVVKNSIVRDGSGDKLVTAYTYIGPRMRGDFRDDHLIGREFLGFANATARHYERVAENAVESADLQYETFVFTQTLATMSTQTNTPPRDPRTGRLIQHQIWSPMQASCKPWQTSEGGRCLLQQTNTTWGAYILNLGSGDWNLWNNNNSSDPLWVRREQVINWVDNAGFKQIFRYDKQQQDGEQYGNVTAVEEYYNDVLQRKTVTEYYPNPTLNVVSLPARVLIYDGAGNCVAQSRTTYVNSLNGSQNRYGEYAAAPSTALPARQDVQRVGPGCRNGELYTEGDPNVFYDNPNWKDNWAITLFAYDGYGNQTTVRQAGDTMAQDQTVTTGYDSDYSLFPVAVTRTVTTTAFVETAKYYGVANGLPVWDSKAFWGATQEHCGVNDLCTRQSYDDFGRPLRRYEHVAKSSTTWPAGLTATILWSYRQPGYYGSSHKTYIVTEWRNPRCYGNFTRRHYNGLGQLITEQGPSQSWQTFFEGCGVNNSAGEIDRYYKYNALGQRTLASVPVAVARTTNFATRPPIWSQGVITTTYDALSRPVSEQAANGDWTYFGYNGQASGVWRKDRTKSNNEADANRMVRWQQVNGLGQLQFVRTYQWVAGTPGGWNPTPDGQVTLAHDVLGNLTQVTSAAGSVTTMTYDLLGHKLSMSDPDLGSWHYGYDRLGQLTRQTDARGKSSCLYYDTMGRLKGKHFRNDTDCPTSLPNPLAWRYNYDGSQTHSKGQLTQVLGHNSSGLFYQKDLTYLTNGLLDTERITIAGGAAGGYATAYSYDQFFRLTTLTYPDGQTVGTHYNSLGLPAKLTSGLAPYEFVDGDVDIGVANDAVHYDEAGRLTRLRLPGSGNLWQHRVYTPFNTPSSNGGQLTTLQSGTSSNPNDAAAGSHLKLTYTYDSFSNISNLSERYNNGATTTANFTYDPQNRLSTAFGWNYFYDAAGRFATYETGEAIYSPAHDSATPHALKWLRIGQGNTVNRDVTVRVAATSGCGGWPLMGVYVNGVLQTQTTVTGTSWQDYTFSLPLTGDDQFDITFSNDCSDGSGDRNLLVDYIQVTTGNGSHTVQAEGAAIFDPGVGTAKFDGEGVQSGSESLLVDGALRFVVATGNRTAANGYDANGNRSYQLRGGLAYVYSYNDENQLSEVKLNGATLESYLYDMNGQRVKKSVGSTSTYYPFPHYEVSGGVVTKYYFFAGQRVAMQSGGTLSYLHSDHLGSTLLATDSAGGVGNPMRDQQYYAYGLYRGGGTLPTDHQFTGQKLDGSGLYYFNARYYDPYTGSFISPDTIVPDPTNVFDYNRYLYARGNPMKYTDPSGHIAVCFRGGFAEQGVSSSSGGTSDFWDACEQTLLQAGYDPAKHGAILRLKNTQAHINQAVMAILAQEQADSSLPVILVGHSWGGAAALETAYLLDPSSYPTSVDPAVLAAGTATVDLLFLIDAELGARMMKGNIPGNVETAVNLYAQTIFPDQWWNLQNGVDYFEGAHNIPAPVLVNFGRGGWFNSGWDRVGHNNIATMRIGDEVVIPNPVTFNLVADYTVQTLFGPPTMIEP
jgi:RHS repeat-associated protein